MADSWVAERLEVAEEAGVSIVRLRGPQGPLQAPMLLCLEKDGAKQMKIVAGETPMLFFEDYSREDKDAAEDFFVRLAKAMNAMEERMPGEVARFAVGQLRKIILHPPRRS